ncbi:MAG: hypothetical protein ACKPKO_49495 [Candidatus Fonsibacter sp.]
MYNFFIELVLHLVKSYKVESMSTLFVFDNGEWAIEDNLAVNTVQEHVLFNKRLIRLK